MAEPLPSAPDYDGAHLRHVLTSAAASLGISGFSNRLNLPEASIAVVILADGLGEQLLARYTGHARFLGSAWRDMDRARVLDTGTPTTTSASLASLGTGLSPGQHGLVGYDVYSPQLQRVVNMLGKWDEEVIPEQWQPHPTVLETAEAAGARVLTASRGKFRTSGLTRAVLRGGEHRGANRIEHRFASAAEWIDEARGGSTATRSGAPQPLLVYLYVDELDKTGHSQGAGSADWLKMLESLDSAAADFVTRLRTRFGSQVSVVLTADHGMVNIAEEKRIDISEDVELLQGVSYTAGEPRFVQLMSDQPEAVAQRWRDRWGDDAWVMTKAQAIDTGLFGPIDGDVSGRIGDVLVALRGDHAIFHTERTGTDPLKMIGHHGSLTRAEREVPLLQL